MIPDEEEDDTIDFSFYYFIGAAKLGLSIKEIGRLTMRTFNRLYKHYKSTFDFELYLRLARKTYAEHEAEVRWNAEIF